MHAQQRDATRAITAQLIVNHEQKAELLPRHFARYMLTVEDSIYMFAQRIVPEFRAVYWHFFELSNGGFYMAPDVDPIQARNLTSAQFRDMTGEALGIAACLLAFRELSSQIQNGVMARHYFQLREFAVEHAEAREIFGVVD
ncbi:MAG: antirestriction protein [Gammaproteobacteria bacterium]